MAPSRSSKTRRSKPAPAKSGAQHANEGSPLAPAASESEPAQHTTTADHLSLTDIEKELKALHRSEREAEAQVQQEEWSNPKVSGPRAAKTRAYADKAWLRNVKRQGGTHPETAGEQTTAPSPSEQRAQEQTVGTKNLPKTRTAAMPATNAASRPKRQVNKARTSRISIQEADDLDSDREPDLHSAVVGERVQAIVSGGEDQDSASLYEISDSASDAEELSDAEREGEEDFGIEKVLVRGTATTRKGKNIATQLQQGTAVVVTTGRRQPPPAPEESDPSDNSEYAYPSDLEQDISDSSASAQASDGAQTESDAEWKEYIARRARRKMAKKMAQSKSSQAENNMTANDHTSAERAGPGIAQTVSKQVATVQDTHNVKIVQLPPQSASKGPSKLAIHLGHVGRAGIVWPKKKLARRAPSTDEEGRGPGSNGSSEGFDPTPKRKVKYRRVTKAAKEIGKMTGDTDTVKVTGNLGNKFDGEASKTLDVQLVKYQAGAADAAQPKSDVDKGGRRWPPETHLTYVTGSSTRIVGLNSQQSPHVHKLLSAAIESPLPRVLMTVNAFPSKAERPPMFLDILVEQATELHLNEIVLCLLDDSIYVQHLMQIPVDRMCTLRGPLFIAARDKLWEAYGLKAIEHNQVMLKKAVTNLLMDSVFIFPGRLENGRYVDVKHDLPFCAGPLIEVVNHLFLRPKAVSSLDKPEKVYKSSYTSGDRARELEIPAVMTAFVATIAGAAIREGLDGQRETHGFSAITQEKYYHGHLATLNALSPLGRHLILGYLYKEGMAFSSRDDAEGALSSSLVDPVTAGMSIKL